MATNISRISIPFKSLEDKRNINTKGINTNILSHKDTGSIDCLVEGEGDLFYKTVFKKKIFHNSKKKYKFLRNQSKKSKISSSKRIRKLFSRGY